MNIHVAACQRGGSQARMAVGLALQGLSAARGKEVPPSTQGSAHSPLSPAAALDTPVERGRCTRLAVWFVVFMSFSHETESPRRRCRKSSTSRDCVAHGHSCHDRDRTELLSAKRLLLTFLQSSVEWSKVELRSTEAIQAVDWGRDCFVAALLAMTIRSDSPSSD